MKPTLPVHLNFRQKAKNGFEIQGKWPLNQLKRLDEVLQSDAGEVDVSLKFGKIGPIPFIEGHITAEVQLLCQRCMQPMAYTVDNPFKLGMVLNEEQIERLPDEFEPYLVDDEDSYIGELLEDELLLALPLVAMHDYECSDYLQEQEPAHETEVKDSEQKENPFAALKDLLK